MLEVVFSLAVAATILFLVERIYNKKRLSPEVSRKIIHIVLALSIATWPYFVSWKAIVLLQLGLLAVLIIARKTTILKSQYAIDRQSWGEFAFILGVIVCALLQPQNWIFVVALLQLGVCDSLAAVVGARFGGKPYKVFGQAKTVVGTLSFWAASFVITAIAVYIHRGQIVEPVFLLAMLPTLATAAENLGVFGLDNLLIPVLVTVMLSLAVV